nr:probable serine/threonine-protein kinase nek3 [Geotrypetes seraphini]
MPCSPSLPPPKPKFCLKLFPEIRPSVITSPPALPRTSMSTASTPILDRFSDLSVQSDILASPSSSPPLSTSPLPIQSPNRCSTCFAPLRPSTRDCGTNPATATTPVAATTIVAHAATNTDPPPSSVTVEDIYTAVVTILAGVEHMNDCAEESVQHIRHVTGALQVLLEALRGTPPTP